MSIRFRLAVGYGIGVVVTLVLVGAFVWWQTGQALRGSLETTLQARATGVAGSLENAGRAGLQEPDQTAPGVFAALFSADGSPIDASADAPSGLRPVNGAFDMAGRHYLLRVDKLGDGTILVTGADLVGIADTQAELGRVLVGVGLLVGTASLFGGWLLAGRALRPVDRLIDDAETLGPSDLSRRLVAPARMDEVGRLTVTLNQMLDRIGDSVDRQRLFVAMASHELRTPLAALRAELDLADGPESSVEDYRLAVHAALGDAVRLSSLASSLLELATAADDGRILALGEVRLEELVATVVRSVGPLARLDRVRVEVELSDPTAIVKVDRTRIEQALVNLLGNAIVHGGRDGEIDLRATIADGAAGRTLLVEVLDRGPGIEATEADRLFVPFSRGAAARGAGSGLGLAMVAGAVDAHGGSYGAEPREGGGARFWFSIPAGRADPDSAAQAGHEVREGGIRPVALGQDGAPVGGTGDRARPRHPDGPVVPGEAKLV
jgi:signal transduction histidine kinase